MSPKPVYCYQHDVLTAAAEILTEHHVRRLVVIDARKRLVGLLSIDDLAAHLSSDRLLGDVVRHLTAAHTGKFKHGGHDEQVGRSRQEYPGNEYLAAGREL
jgi:CBS domain-containing protein